MASDYVLLFAVKKLTITTVILRSIEIVAICQGILTLVPLLLAAIAVIITLWCFLHRCNFIEVILVMLPHGFYSEFFCIIVLK